MDWEKVPCRHCGMNFENLYDRDEHERCHVASTAEVKTELNSRCSVQACCRVEGHDGNHWCSVCNVRDLAGVEYFEHECYPTEV